MAKQHRISVKVRSQNLLLLLTVTLLFFINANLYADQQNNSEPIQYGSFDLKHISANQGKQYLDSVGIGTVSPIPNSRILVTANRLDLQKAKAVLDLVDREEFFAVKSLRSQSALMNKPSNRQVQEILGDIPVGNFLAPPAINDNGGVIIDFHNDAVVVVAPAEIMDTIVSLIEPTAAANIMQTPEQTINNQQAITELPDLNRPNNNVPANNQPTGSNIPAPITTQNNNVQNTEPQRYVSPLTSPQITPMELAQELFASAAPEETVEQEITIPNADQIITLNLPERQSLIDFLSLAGNYLEMNLVYNADDIRGEVTFNLNGDLRGSITIRDLYHLLETVLQSTDYVMTRTKGNIVRIVSKDNAMDIDPDFISDGGEGLQAGDIISTEYFELDYIDTESAQELLTSMKLTIDITAIAETQTLFVTAYSYRMPKIRTYLGIIDKPGRPKLFKYRQLLHTRAEEIAPKLQALSEQMGTVSITIASTVESTGTLTPPRQEDYESTAEYQAAVRNYQQRLIQQRNQAQQQSTTGGTSTTQIGEATSSAVYLDADERTNRILMIGRQDQIDEVENLINTLDIEQQDLRNLRRYNIEHIDAENVRSKLISLGVISASSETNTSPSTNLSASQITARAQSGVLTGDMSGAVAGEPYVVVVEPTNSLLVYATDQQHRRITDIIAQVDNPAEQIPYEVYQLKNQDPNRIADLLQRFVDERTDTAAAADTEAKITGTASQSDDEVIIVPYNNTSSLVVYANKRNQEWIGSLIEKLDIRQSQVLIDVILVQISKTDAFNYDLNLLSSVPDLTSTSGITSALLPGVEAGASNLVQPLLNSRRNKFLDFQSSSTGGTAFYGDEHINALLTSMQQKDYGRIMAKPQILVIDNKEGTIDTNDTTFVTTTTGTIVEGTTGAVQTSTDFEDYSAGVTLKIKPHISESDLLRLEINLKRSDFGNMPENRPPDQSSSTVDTEVTIPNGSTIILGGMSKLNQSKGDTKVPFFGDLPLIGGLFRSSNNSDVQKNLYVFIKAQVIRPLEDGTGLSDIALISNTERAAFEAHEEEFQKYQGWPGIESGQMTPFRILDAQ